MIIIFITGSTCVSMHSALMLQSNEDHINFRIENVQIQEGGVDCGLFAIAFTTEYCFGNNPKCYRWSCMTSTIHKRKWKNCFQLRYDQNKTREHILRCTENGECPPFLPNWQDVNGQLEWKKYNFTVTAVCRRMVKNLWHNVKAAEAVFQVTGVTSKYQIHPDYKQGWFCSHFLC